MDNCGIHHVDGVYQRCAARSVLAVSSRLLLTCCSGVLLIYLPPYSPDFNPIEEFFSAMKAYARRHSSRFRAVMKAKDNAAVAAFVFETFRHIATEENIEGWFRRYLKRT